MDTIRRIFSAAKEKHITTPSFIYLEKRLEKNLQSFDAFTRNGIPVFYAMKSSNHQDLLKKVIKRGFGIDVATAEELRYILQMGVDVSKVSFSAPTKKEWDVAYAASVGVTKFAFDTEFGMRQILKYVSRPMLFARVAITNHDAAFDLSSKFGMSETYFTSILKTCHRNDWPLHGLTFHVGSQNISMAAWKTAIKKIEKFLKIAHEMGIKISHVNLGGGIPGPYSRNVRELDFYIQNIIALIKNLQKKIPGLECYVEPGRGISSNTMVLVTKILDIKHYKKPPVIIVDTSAYNGLVEPLTDLELPVCCEGSNRKRYYQIGGFTCDGTDILNKRVTLSADLQPNDFLIFECAGAYTHVYEKFHLVPFPEKISFEALTPPKKGKPHRTFDIGNSIRNSVPSPTLLTKDM